MKIILQRVLTASVKVNNETVGCIDKGYAIFLGIGADDTKEQVEKMANKIKKLRIFSDENEKINLSIDDVDGELLVVSQFTLYADCKKGNRPSFVNAGSPVLAEELYEYFLDISSTMFRKVEHGVFGGDMKVQLVNDGPFTLILESD